MHIPWEDDAVEHQHTTIMAPVSTLSDSELDVAMAALLSTFPDFGRTMIAGHFAAYGHRVPSTHLHQSYLHVHGAPPSFSHRQVVRKKYQVPGPNSLALQALFDGNL